MIYIFLLISFSFSAVLNVPSDYRTINEAFDNVSDNDTVLVATGTHYVFKGIEWPEKNNVSLIGDGAAGDVIMNLKYMIPYFDFGFEYEPFIEIDDDISEYLGSEVTGEISNFIFENALGQIADFENCNFKISDITVRKSNHIKNNFYWDPSDNSIFEFSANNIYSFNNTSFESNIDMKNINIYDNKSLQENGIEQIDYCYADYNLDLFFGDGYIIHEEEEFIPLVDFNGGEENCYGEFTPYYFQEIGTPPSDDYVPASCSNPNWDPDSGYLGCISLQDNFVFTAEVPNSAQYDPPVAGGGDCYDYCCNLNLGYASNYFECENLATFEGCGCPQFIGVDAVLAACTGVSNWDGTEAGCDNSIPASCTDDFGNALEDWDGMQQGCFSGMSVYTESIGNPPSEDYREARCVDYFNKDVPGWSGTLEDCDSNTAVYSAENFTFTFNPGGSTCLNEDGTIYEFWDGTEYGCDNSVGGGEWIGNGDGVAATISFCSDGVSLDEATCVANNSTWYPGYDAIPETFSCTDGVSYNQADCEQPEILSTLVFEEVESSCIDIDGNPYPQTTGFECYDSCCGIYFGIVNSVDICYDLVNNSGCGCADFQIANSILIDEATCLAGLPSTCDYLNMFDEDLVWDGTESGCDNSGMNIYDYHKIEFDEIDIFDNYGTILDMSRNINLYAENIVVANNIYATPFNGSSYDDISMFVLEGGALFDVKNIKIMNNASGYNDDFDNSNLFLTAINFQPSDDGTPTLNLNNALIVNNQAGYIIYDDFSSMNMSNSNVSINYTSISNNSNVDDNNTSVLKIGQYGENPPVILNSILWNDNNQSMFDYDDMGPYGLYLTVGYSNIYGFYNFPSDEYDMMMNDGHVIDLGGNLNGTILDDPMFLYTGNDYMNSNFYMLDSQSPSVDAAYTIHSDACSPPGVGSYRADMGYYGGPGNCFNGEYNMLDGSPSIDSIVDMPDDQGGYVGIQFEGSYFDGESEAYMITHYSIWRELEVNPEDSTMTFSTTPEDDNIFILGREDYWEHIGNMQANGFEHYGYTASTIADTNVEGPFVSTFIVIAHTQNPEIYFTSLPASGESIDNLAPVAPTNIVGDLNLDLNNVVLTWFEPEINDIHFYEIYKEDEFVNVAYGNSFIDESMPTPVDYIYNISAVDVNGNISELSETYNFCSPVSGDSNLDLIVNILDVVILVNYIFDDTFDTLTPCVQNIMDVSGEGELNVVDIVQIVNIIFNNIESFQNNFGITE